MSDLFQFIMKIGMKLSCLAGVLAAVSCAGAQVIEFESGGLKYLTQTKSGVTIMFAHLPSHLRDYWVVQAAVSNGSSQVWTVRPEDFSFVRTDGTEVRAVGARSVVDKLVSRASRSDVVKLISTYEIGLYGMQRIQSTNGYEQRRQAAQAEFGSMKIKAAAAASAIALVSTKLKPGESTDGAVFYPSNNRPLGAGKLIVRAAGAVFEFNSEAPTGTP
jgi:hypothetical protein